MRSLGTPASIQSCSASSSRGTSASPFEDGDVELVFGDAEPVGRGDELPGEGDGVVLEVVAEAEVAEHFEKRMVAAGEADVFEVVVLAAGADAFLRSGGALVVALLDAEEDVFELVHACVGEEQRGVVGGDERGGVDAAVALGLKEAQKSFADVVAGAGLHAATSLAEAGVHSEHEAEVRVRGEFRRRWEARRWCLRAA